MTNAAVPEAKYGEFIAEELDREYQRRSRIDGWASTSITSVTGFVTLFAGVIALVDGQMHVLTGCMVYVAFGAPLFLFLAGICAIVARASRKTCVLTATTLNRMIHEMWRQDDETTARIIAQVKVDTLVSLRKGTNRKAGWLIATSILQVVAILLLSLIFIPLASA